MRRTYRTLNDYEMQHSAEVGLFTRPSQLNKEKKTVSPSEKQTMHLLNGMLRPYEPLLMTLLRVADSLLGVALFIGVVKYFSMDPPTHICIREAAILIFIMSLVFFNAVGIYRSWRFSSLKYEISQIFFGCFIFYAFLFLIVYLLKMSDDFSRTIVISWMIIWPVFISIGRIIIRSILRHFRKMGHNVRRTVIAGHGTMAEELARLITENPWSGTQIEGFFDDRTRNPVKDLPFLGNLNALPEYIKKNKIDIVYFALSLKAESKIKSLLRNLADSTVSIYFVPDVFFLDLILGGSITYFENFPVIALRDTPIRGINTLFKRLEDLVLASLVLILTSPVFLIIAIIIKLTSKGPVFFEQWRYGLGGRPIVIYKFRTMTVCEDGNNFTQATKDDSRVTPFGAFLRHNSLDELPQFMNVLQGRMSLVGPRPHPVAMNEEYRKLVPGYMLRHKVKPGITGLAQVNGFRGETDSLDKMEKRVKYDLDYLRRWSLMLDLQIMVKTVFNGAWRKNAY